MICFDVGTPYQLKGCRHTICTTCAEKLQELPSCVKHPFSQNMTVLLPVHDHVLKCPYCTISEPSQYNIDQLRQWYPHQYRVWVEAELRYNPRYESTHLCFADDVKFPDSRKRSSELEFYIFHKNDIIEDIEHLRPLKITYTDPFIKHQLNERKVRAVHNRRLPRNDRRNLHR
jgi:hypothetical protein